MDIHFMLRELDKELDLVCARLALGHSPKNEQLLVRKDHILGAIKHLRSLRDLEKEND